MGEDAGRAVGDEHGAEDEQHVLDAVEGGAEHERGDGIVVGQPGEQAGPRTPPASESP
jgi:hypothetical protein